MSLRTYKRIVKLFTYQPYFFGRIISRYYPFDEISLNQYQEILDWQLVSQNKNILFSHKLIKKFKQKWFWSELTKNDNVFWTEDMITEIKEYLNRPNHILGNPMENLCGSNNVVWDIKILENISEIINWKVLSSNKNIQWSKELIQKFRFNLDWEVLCTEGIFWNKDYIIELETDLDYDLKRWNYLLYNKNIIWSNELICLFGNKWFWKPKYTCYGEPDFYDNPQIPWNNSLLNKYKVELNWYKLSKSNR